MTCNSGCSNPCRKCGSGYISQMPAEFSYNAYDVRYEQDDEGPGLDHPSFSKHERQWLKSRIACKGSDAVDKHSELFLHQLPGMTSSEYDYYKLHARFPGYLKRVKKAVEAKVFLEREEIQSPFELNDLDSEGLSFHALERWALNEVMEVLWGGLLVDANEDGDIRIVRYNAENVRNWKHDKNGNLVKLVLREFCDINPDSFRHEVEERRRVLTLIGGVYVVQVYRLLENKEDQKKKERAWVLIEDEDESGVREFTIPRTGQGEILQAIPFFPFGGGQPGESILDPLLGVSKDMYNLDAWKKNVLREGCFPQKVLNCTGEDVEYAENTDWFGEPLSDGHEKGAIELGTSKILILRDAELSIVESSGSSANLITEEQDRLKEEAFDYGTSLFKVRNSSNVAAETERMQQSTDTSLVNAMARYVSEALSAALNVVGQWLGQDAPDYQLVCDPSMGEIELRDILSIQAGIEARLFAREDGRDILRRARLLRRSSEDIDEDLESQDFDDRDLITP